jgi:hypothetical protein
MSTETRTFSGWRRSRGMGLFGLGVAQTLIVLGAIIATILASMFGLQLLLVTAPIALVVIGATVAQWDGVPLAAGVLQRLRFTRARSKGYTAFKSGIMVDDPDAAWQLPGALAPTALLPVTGADGERYAVVWNKRTGLLTVALRCAAQSTWLADPESAATWVSNWGSWLAGLGHQPMVQWISVTVDTAPDRGGRLGDYVTGRIAPNAPAAAVRLLQQLVAAAPATAADVQTTVAITFDPNRSPARPRTLIDSVEEVDRALPGLLDGLALCGLSVLGRADADHMAAVVREAFDPAVRGEVRRHEQALDWGACGPVAATELHDRYVHDSGVSVSWALHEAPRQPVQHSVLAWLVGPGSFTKRVTLLYQPFTAAEAAKVVESQVNAAQFREAMRRARKMDPRARDVADHEYALQAAREEAAGAGLGLLTLFVTVTVTDAEQLPKAVADVESRAGMSKIRLRRCWGSQSAAFAATLPVGVFPPMLARQWPN